MTRLLGLLGVRDDPGRERRRLLRDYARRVARSRPRLYNHRAASAEPALGVLLHTYYRALGPARILLRNAKLSAVLKTVAAERSLNERQREILLGLGEDALVSKAKGTSAKDLVQAVRDQMTTLVKAFDKRAVERARRAYRAVIILVDLVNFDYWSVLRKFDARYPEADFTYSPRFLPLDAEHVNDALKDFLEVLAPVDPDLDWKEALAILKDYRGMELVSAEGWSSLMRVTTDLRHSGVLLAIVRLMDNDPTYVPRLRTPEGRVVETYVETVRRQTETVLRRVLETQRQQNVEALARQVFGDAELPRLTNYTSAQDEKLLRKGLPPFAYVATLGYVKAYLIELHKTRVKELVDALIIRGTWKESAVSRSLTDNYQEVLAVLPDLVEFDRRLGDNQELGVKLKGAVTRADRAKPQTLVPARQIVDVIDTHARGLVMRTAQGCVSLGQTLRALVEDSGQPSPQIIANWRELKGPTPREETRALLVDVFRRLQGLSHLLRITVNRPSEKAGTASDRPDSATPAEDPSEAGEASLPS